MRLSSWLRSARSRFVPNGTTKRLTTRARPTRLSVEHLEDRTVPSTFTVTTLADSGPDSLRAAIVAANTNPGADVIAFAHGLRGTVTLTSGELGITDDLRIDGPGANKLAVSGNDASRVFNIGSSATVSIDDLTITHGRGDRRGGGILNAGTLTLSRAVVSDNVVVGLPGATMAEDAMGGGVLNNGTLTVSHTLFSGNRSVGGDGIVGKPGSTALGGAIMSAGSPAAPATATVTHSTFLDNEAVGGAMAPPFSRAGLGGAIMNAAGTTTVSHSYFNGNRAVGGAGGGFIGGVGAGGAIANISAGVRDSTISVSHSTLVNNQAIGGAAAPGLSPQIGRGGAIANFVAPIAALPVSVTATASVSNSVILGNRAIGGAGTTGGNGQGGGIANENGGILTVTNSVLLLNRAIGGVGDGGNGGNGQGGGIFNGPPNPFGVPNLALNRSLVGLNRADGGAASAGGSAGLGTGGGLYLAPGGVASADRTAVFANDADTSDDVFGILV